MEASLITLSCTILSPIAKNDTVLYVTSVSGVSVFGGVTGSVEGIVDGFCSVPVTGGRDVAGVLGTVEGTPEFGEDVFAEEVPSETGGE